MPVHHYLTLHVFSRVIQVMKGLHGVSEWCDWRFCTSCSRAPLLGPLGKPKEVLSLLKRRFKNLNPKFCVHRVPDSERLPTSATCANLLKLPDYVQGFAASSRAIGWRQGELRGLKGQGPTGDSLLGRVH